MIMELISIKLVDKDGNKMSGHIRRDDRNRTILGDSLKYYVNIDGNFLTTMGEIKGRSLNMGSLIYFYFESLDEIEWVLSLYYPMYEIIRYPSYNYTMRMV